MADNGNLYFVSALAEDEEVISYRPKLARALGHDPDAAILLQRIAYYWVKAWKGTRRARPSTSSRSRAAATSATGQETPGWKNSFQRDGNSRARSA